MSSSAHAVVENSFTAVQHLTKPLFLSKPAEPPLFFADRFQEIVPHVGPLALGIACFSLSAIVAHVLTALGSRIGFLPSWLALGAWVALFAFRHDSLADVVSNQIRDYGLQLVLMLAAVVVTTRHPLIRQHSAAPSAAAEP